MIQYIFIFIRFHEFLLSEIILPNSCCCYPIQLFLMKVADFFRGDNPEGIEARNEVNKYILRL